MVEVRKLSVTILAISAVFSFIYVSFIQMNYFGIYFRNFLPMAAQTNTTNASSDQRRVTNTSISSKAKTVTLSGAYVRETRCDKCFPHDFRYIIPNEEVCRRNNSEQIIDLFIMILTTAKNYQARDAIRTTWLTISKSNTANVRYIFLLGAVKNDNDQNAIIKEANTYHDIVQEDFVDVYMNLTYKTMMGFKYAATLCSHARFVLKTDEDMYINVPHLVTYLNTSSKELQNKITGSCSKAARPIRNSKSKWYASEKSYKEKMYPGFCSGTAYATSMTVVQKIYNISYTVPFFHLEDIYVSLCLHLIGGSVIHNSRFNIGRPKFNACLYKGDKLLSAHTLTPTMLRSIWAAKCK